MPLSVIPPALLIAAIFAFLPFAGGSRFFSLAVDSEWLRSGQARQLRLWYQGTVALVAALCVVLVVFAGQHLVLIYALPVAEVVALAVAWSWGWRRTLPFRLSHPIQRSASLRPSAGTQNVWWWASLFALLPLAGVATILTAHFQAIPHTFAIHFNAAGVADHTVVRSGVSVFSPVALGAVVAVLLAGILRAIQRQGAGLPDGGRYGRWTGAFVAGVSWVVALESAAVAFLPLVANPARYAARLGVVSGVVALLLLLVTTGVLIGNRSVLVSAQGATDEAHWRGGLIYFNRDDAALFVPKRLGFGWTLNMARPAAWLLMALVFAIPLLQKAMKFF